MVSIYTRAWNTLSYIPFSVFRLSEFLSNNLIILFFSLEFLKIICSILLYRIPLTPIFLTDIGDLRFSAKGL